ncbi:MAG: hypothetical protein EBZ77_05560 [Chitinophagia bacterium]|nr:hypothetical protein [Chitinophagia bacterium]
MLRLKKLLFLGLVFCGYLAKGQGRALPAMPVPLDAENTTTISNHNKRYPITSYRKKYCLPVHCIYFVQSNRKYLKHFEADYFEADGRRFYLDSLTHTKGIFDAQCDLVSCWELTINDAPHFLLKADIGQTGTHMLILLLRWVQGQPQMSAFLAPAANEQILFSAPVVTKNGNTLLLEDDGHAGQPLSAWMK